MRLYSAFAAILISTAPSIAMAQSDPLDSPLLQTDSRGNIDHYLAIPDGLPDRDVADLEPGSRCLIGGVLCLATAMDDERGALLIVQDRKWPRRDPEARKTIDLNGGIDRHAVVSLWSRHFELVSTEDNLAPSYIIGVIGTSHQYFSGGSALASTLYLYAATGLDSPYPHVREILALPFQGEKHIRACFSEDDEDLRLGACQDSYSFASTVRMAPIAEGHWPSLSYSAFAGVYPRTASLVEDSLAEQLLPEDLVSETDLTCTFDRTLNYNPFIGRYEFESPGPDCSDYLIDADE